MLIAVILVLATAGQVRADGGLTAAVAAAYLPRNVDATLHEIAHQRAAELRACRCLEHNGMRPGTAEVVAWNDGVANPQTFNRLGAVTDAEAAVVELAKLTAPHQQHAVFMFTDILRSTPLVEALGDDAWTDLVNWHDGTLRRLFAQFGGEELDHAGDGFFVAFGDAKSAVACAVAIQRTLRTHRREHGFAPDVRIGLHADKAARSGRQLRGRGVHVAARIGAMASGGEILISAEMMGEVGEDTPIDQRRTVELKGLKGSFDVASIRWVSPSA